MAFKDLQMTIYFSEDKKNSISFSLSVNFIVDMQPMVLLKANVHKYHSKNLELNYGYLIHLWQQHFSKE